MPVFGSGDFAGKNDRVLGHARKFDPLPRELRIGFLEPDMRGAACRFLRCRRKFEISRDSFFAIIVRTHTRILIRAKTPVRTSTPSPQIRS